MKPNPLQRTSHSRLRLPQLAAQVKRLKLLSQTTMHRYAKKVSATASGDYYQLTLDDGDVEEEQAAQPEQSGPYVLLQRQFEMADGGRCYVESDDEDYIGHFRLKLDELTPNRLAFGIDRVKNNRVEVDFELTPAQFKEVLPIAEVIFGLREPEYGDDAL